MSYYLKLGHDHFLDILSNLSFYFPFDEVSADLMTASLNGKDRVWVVW